MNNNPDLVYIASNIATGEGTRHYFILQSIQAKYTALNGAIVDRFMVYTSTGKNTKGICGTELCLIPCFGTMTMWHGNNIIGPIIKADFYVGAGRYLTSKNAQLNYAKSLKYFDGNVSDSLIRKYFGHSEETDLLYKDLKIKCGSDYFLSDIMYYKDRIFAFIADSKNLCFAPNLLFINKALKSSNFYGLDLSKLKCYSSLIDTETKQYRADMFISDKTLIQKYNKNIAHYMEWLKNKEPDKYDNIMGSPPEGLIYYYVNMD